MNLTESLDNNKCISDCVIFSFQIIDTVFKFRSYNQLLRFSIILKSKIRKKIYQNK